MNGVNEETHRNIFFDIPVADALAAWGHYVEEEMGIPGQLIRGYRCDGLQLIVWLGSHGAK